MSDAEKDLDELLEAALLETNAAEEISIGDLTLGETGLSLPIDLATKEEQLEAREITAADLAALSEVEAELDQRWSEVKIDPTLSRIELLLRYAPACSYPSKSGRR